MIGYRIVFDAPNSMLFHNIPNFNIYLLFYLYVPQAADSLTQQQHISGNEDISWGNGHQLHPSPVLESGTFVGPHDTKKFSITRLIPCG